MPLTNCFQGAPNEAERTQSTQRQSSRRDQRRDLGHGVTVTASITNEAVTDLGLKKGDDAWAVIKASDVMIGK
jgi:molybdopterin-binding protein